MYLGYLLLKNSPLFVVTESSEFSVIFLTSNIVSIYIITDGLCFMNTNTSLHLNSFTREFDLYLDPDPRAFACSVI